MKSCDGIIRYRIGVGIIVPIYNEIISVVSVQAIIRSEPHEPLLILYNTPDSVLRKPLIDSDVFEIYLTLLSIQLLPCNQKQLYSKTKYIKMCFDVYFILPSLL